MKERTDPHLNILLNIEEKLGDLRAETSKQSAQLEAVVNKQDELTDYQKYANSKTAKVIQDIQDIKDERNINKGKMFVFMAIGGFVMTTVSAILVILIKRYFGI